MTDEQMRIAIAEACDLFKFKPLRYATRKGKLLELGEKGVRLMYCSGGTNGWEDWEDIPDYLNDLNAMHEAERMLPAARWDRYTQWLGELAKGTRRFVVCHATARQRAEAFLKTLNLWKD